MYPPHTKPLKGKDIRRVYVKTVDGKEHQTKQGLSGFWKAVQDGADFEQT